jgi:L-threonylcarbamoyladenylate synthase
MPPKSPEGGLKDLGLIASITNNYMIEDIKKALEVLRKGGTILYPTDTIWGIGCDTTNPDAVKRVYEIKKRNDNKSMLVLLDEVLRLNEYVSQVPDIAWDLIEVTDSPLTIIYPGAKNLASNIVAPDGSVGIRITHDEFCKRLIGQFKKPIVSTSANVSEKSAPANFTEIDPAIIDAVDYVVQWRQDDYTHYAPSGIIKLGLKGEVQVIRK